MTGTSDSGNHSAHAGEKFLVVSSDPVVRETLAATLQAGGFPSDTCASPAECFGRLKLREYDLVFCHIDLNDPASADFLELMGQRPEGSELVLIANPGDPKVGKAAVKWGAWDWMVYPDETGQMETRLMRAVEFARLKRARGLGPQEGHDRMRQEKERICAGFYDTMKLVVRTLESKDPAFTGHCRRVREFALWISRELGLDGLAEAEIALASELHDIGYVGISDQIQTKPGRLEEKEMAAVRRHPDLGFQILKSILPGRSSNLVRHHHERWDGTGYPLGLHENLIPVGSRVIALADAFDAMTSRRPWRAALTAREALSEIRDKAGSQFDPAMVPCFMDAVAQRMDSHPHLLRMREV